MRPIEAGLYTVVMEIRITQRRARDLNRDDVAAELEPLKQQVLDIKRRLDGVDWKERGE